MTLAARPPSLRPLLPLALLAATSLAGCGADDTVEAETPGVTWHADIRPIFDAHCNGCHGPGATVAPFELTDHEAVVELLPVIEASLADGSMPPWGASAGVEMIGDLSLTADQLALFESWVEAGAPEGDPDRPGAPITLDSVPFLGADQTLSIEAPYAGEPGRLDEYRCFVVPWPDGAERYVTGLAVDPDNVEAVHHVLAFVVPPEGAEAFDGYDAADPLPGYACFGQPYPVDRGPTPASALPPSTLIGAWTPGQEAQGMADGVGIGVAPGSRIVIQMHYYGLADSGVPDQSAVSFSTAETVAQPSCVLPLIDLGWYFDPTSLVIPAGESDVQGSFEMSPATSFGPVVCPDIDWQGPLELHAVMPHQHKLGRRLELTLRRADGEQVLIVDADRYDFDWQRNYLLADPIEVGPGDTFAVRCVWDNTPPIRAAADLDPTPVDVHWGDDSDSEMCLVMAHFARPAEP